MEIENRHMVNSKKRRFGFGLKFLIGLTFVAGVFAVGFFRNSPLYGVSNRVLPWEPGFLDIHHINTGAGNAAYLVFPDGTTFLIDAGEMGAAFREAYINKSLRVAPRRPSDDWTGGAAVVNYIKQVAPHLDDRTRNLAIDYALITHFHADHYGDVDNSSQLAKNGKYYLSGITEVDQHIPISTLFDRGFPSYTFPVDLKTKYANDRTFENYLKFIQANGTSGHMVAQQLHVGRSDQIKMVKNASGFSDFQVRCLKKNGEAWTGSGEDTTTLFNAETFLQLWPDGGYFNENPLSIGLTVKYGNFTYFTGGDMTGLRGYGMPEWYDTETPITSAVGRVDVTTLNHHGNRDGTNINFVHNLQPQVVVQQAWCSDHPGMEPFYRLISDYLYKSGQKPDMFSTYMHENVKWTYGRKFVSAYKSMYGHVVVRVLPGGDEFLVYVLDDLKPELSVKHKFGPYKTVRSAK